MFKEEDDLHVQDMPLQMKILWAMGNDLVINEVMVQRARDCTNLSSKRVVQMMRSVFNYGVNLEA